MKKIYCPIIFLFLLSTFVMALDLSEYPAPFVIDGVYDESTVFVVGARASASDLIAVADISTILQSETGYEITPVVKLDTEIKDLYQDYNLIIVGTVFENCCPSNPCNELLQKFGLTCNSWTFKQGEGIIKLDKNGNKVALIVAGTTNDDTRRAAKVLLNYKDYVLSGTQLMVKGTTINEATIEFVSASSMYASVDILEGAKKACTQYCNSNLCGLFVDPKFPQPELKGKNCFDLGVICNKCVVDYGQEEPTCDSPRIAYDGQCCLDADNSGVCDMVEEASKRKEELAQEEKAKAEEGIPSQEIPPTETKPAEEIQPPTPSTQGGVNLIIPLVFLAVIGAIFVIDAVFSFSKKASKKLKKPKKHCQECGATLGPDDAYCPECGEKV